MGDFSWKSLHFQCKPWFNNAKLTYVDYNKCNILILYLLSTESSTAESGESVDTPETPVSSRGKGEVRVSSIPKLVDNKRKHMEKRLSQTQKYQFLMSTAKDDLMMKKDMLEAFEKSNKTLDDAISKMTNCLTSLGNGIAQGMQMLATAMANPRPPPPHYGQMHYNGNPQQHILPQQYYPSHHYQASTPMTNASYNGDSVLDNSQETPHYQDL